MKVRRLTVLEGVAAGLVGIVGVNLFDRLLFAFSSRGRVARRVARIEGGGPIAGQLVTLGRAMRAGTTQWQSAQAIHTAASIVEELATRLAADPQAKFGTTVELLRERLIITNESARSMHKLYQLRNNVRGAGHGIGTLQFRDAQQRVDEAFNLADELAALCPTDPRSVRGRLRPWWLILVG